MQNEPTPSHPKQPGRVTLQDIQQYPYYYLRGAGRAAAEESHCGHGYRLTASCPNCP